MSGTIAVPRKGPAAGALKRAAKMAASVPAAFADRQARQPLPLSAKLETFTCFCERSIKVGPMEPNTTRITSCECGRRWRQQT